MPATEMEVELLSVWGSDLDVVDAARVSFNKRSEWAFDPDTGEKKLKSKDAKLIQYLVRCGHWTTWAHCSARFRVKAPIFVARQLVKSSVGLVWNEVSRRYVDSAPEYWLPTELHARPEGSIKQGAGVRIANDDLMLRGIDDQVQQAIRLYDRLIADGVAPEEARIVLPLCTMTEWWWTGSLAAWARVCALRIDPHVQGATREIAVKFDEALRPHFPVTWQELAKWEE